MHYQPEGGETVSYYSSNMKSLSRHVDYLIKLNLTCVTDEVKTFLPHLNSDNAFLLQFRVNRGELSTEFS